MRRRGVERWGPGPSKVMVQHQCAYFYIARTEAEWLMRQRAARLTVEELSFYFGVLESRKEGTIMYVCEK